MVPSQPYRLTRSPRWLPEAAKLEAKERRRGRGEQIFFISLKIISSGVHTVPLAIVDSFSRRGLALL